MVTVRRLSACALLAGLVGLACNTLLGIDAPNVLPDGACLHNSDCEEPNICVFRTCAPRCLGDVDCEEGARCLHSELGTACVRPDQATCTTPSDCPEGTVCSSGMCRTDCSADSGICLTGQVCTSSGVCRGTNAAHDPPPGPAVLGEPCEEADALACSGFAELDRLRCEGSKWVLHEACAEGTLCNNDPDQRGECGEIPEECVGREANEAFCEGATRKLCGPDRLTVDRAECQSAQHCSYATGPACAECLPNEFACDGNTLRKCNEALTGFVDEKTCTDQPCSASAGDCTPYACGVGAKRCQGDVLEVCNADRSGFVEDTDCGADRCDLAALECAPCTLPAPTRAGTTFACQEGEWVITGCPTGTLSCDTSYENGCETDATTLANCRSCGNGCSFACGTSDCDELVKVAAGVHHSCGITTSGAAYCWGRNQSGQLGDDSTDNRDAPTPVSGLSSGVTAIRGGELHTCVIRGATATVSCWGDNTHGQISGTSPFSRVPAPVSALANILDLDVGHRHSCAVTSAGAVRCWGQQERGRLGNGLEGVAVVSAPTPNVLLPGPTALTDAVQVVAGESHTCVRRTGGTVACFGDNQVGQLGVGTLPASATQTGYAQAIPGLSNVSQLATGGNHTCALSGGSVYCWGFNGSRQVGQASGTSHNTPQQVAGITNAQSIAAGYHTTCAVLQSGQLMCWGANAYGERGEPPSAVSATPATITSLPDVEQVSSYGWGHLCAMRSSGLAVCLGRAGYGQLGNRSDVDTHVPQTLTLGP